MNDETKKENDVKVIRFFARSVYGDTKFYPVDFAYELEMLTGNKTLVARTFASLEAMGLRFVEVLDPDRKKMKDVEILNFYSK